MKKITIFCFFILSTLNLFPQKDSTKGTIIVIGSQCDDVKITIGSKNDGDTLSYSELKKNGGFTPRVINCNANAVYTLKTYNIAINGENKKLSKGPNYDFKQIPITKEGKIVITNCIVECKIEGHPTKHIIIPIAEFFLIP